MKKNKKVSVMVGFVALPAVVIFWLIFNLILERDLLEGLIFSITFGLTFSITWMVIFTIKNRKKEKASTN